MSFDFRPPLWLIALIAFALGAAVTSNLVRNHYRVVIADIQADQDKAVVAAYQSGIARLQEEKVRGDRLSADLAATESALHRKSLEVSHALRHLTVGRPCLDSGAVRLLNDTYAAAPVPKAASAPVAADGEAATDTDVSDWIALAWNRYETCRSRLDTLIVWWEPATL